MNKPDVMETIRIKYLGTQNVMFEDSGERVSVKMKRFQTQKKMSVDIPGGDSSRGGYTRHDRIGEGELRLPHDTYRDTAKGRAEGYHHLFTRKSSEQVFRWRRPQEDPSYALYSIPRYLADIFVHGIIFYFCFFSFFFFAVISLLAPDLLFFLSFLTARLSFSSFTDSGFW